MAEPTDGILIERRNSLLRVTFDRQEHLNALTYGMLTTAARAIESGAEDPTVRAVLITGTGRAFSSGADLTDLDGHHPGATPLDAANRLVSAIVAAPKPVMCAVNGVAAGVGCSIAVAADLTVATRSATFLLAFAKLGLMPDGGATELIAAAVGRARAMRMALLAERISADEAVAWGLIAAVHDDADFAGETEQLAARLAAGPTRAYGMTKAAINVHLLDRLPAALARETAGQQALSATADAAEGLSAFADRRPALFNGC